MNSGAQPARGCCPPPAGSGLESGRKYLSSSRIAGKISACIFLVAALAVVDGLQTLIRHEFNEISIVPGETLAITGMMPQNATSHSELAVEMEGLAGISFEPTEAFKGFWMGGNMWRANLKADAKAAPGKGTLTVVDMVPLKKVGRSTVRDEDSPRGVAAKPAEPPAAPVEGGPPSGSSPEAPGKEADAGPPMMGQNPALVYSVVVWPSVAARDAADPSYIHRLTGQPPFLAAGIAAGLALLCGVCNSILFSRAEALLARHGVYFIHGIKRKEDGLHAAFAYANNGNFAAGDEVLLYDMRWQERASGVIAEKTPLKGFARFPFTGTAPQYGWLLALKPGTAHNS